MFKFSFRVYTYNHPVYRSYVRMCTYKTNFKHKFIITTIKKDMNNTILSIFTIGLSFQCSFLKSKSALCILMLSIFLLSTIMLNVFLKIELMISNQNICKDSKTFKIKLQNV